MDSVFLKWRQMLKTPCYKICYLLKIAQFGPNLTISYVKQCCWWFYSDQSKSLLSTYLAKLTFFKSFGSAEQEEHYDLRPQNILLDD